MTPQEFFLNSLSNCPICNKDLSSESNLDIIIDNIKNNNSSFTGTNFSYIGTVFYRYKKIFTKSGFVPLEGKYKNIINVIYNNLPKTNSMNKRVSTKINKSKINDLIYPWYIFDTDTWISRGCYSYNHTYVMRSTSLFQNGLSNSFELASEYLSTKNYTIINPIYSNQVLENQVSHIKTNKLNSIDEIPYIPINKWNIDKIDSQVEKVLLLK